jgi:hypothetical protein
MLNIRSELKTILFFILYFTTAFIFEKTSPSGVCTPGPGFLLFMLSVPISIIYTLILFFKYYRFKDKEYLNSIYIVSGMWVLIFIVLNFNN